MNLKFLFCCILIFLFSRNAFAISSSLRAGDKLVGKKVVFTIPINNKYPLEYFAKNFQTGLSNLLETNPGIDPYLPKSGASLTVPNQIILPDVPHTGIVINNPEMRLYYYPPGQHRVVILPIGIGEVDRATPLEWVTTIVRKKKYPTWTPTSRIRADYAVTGIRLPSVFPSGPDNPMGLYALYIGKMFAIHGTNADFGIGLRISHGCVRLRNSDIESLFNQVKVGTQVTFINQPVKYTQESDGSKYIEVHEPLSMTKNDANLSSQPPLKLSSQLRKVLSMPDINQKTLAQALHQRSGLPIKIN